MPTLKDFGFKSEPTKDDRAAYDFMGGENKAQSRLQEYFKTQRSIAHYGETRSNLNGANFASFLSPWVANGSVSIRDLYWHTKAVEEDFGQNESTKKFIDELFWRDFFRYWCYRNDTKVFFEYGIYDRTQYKWQKDL